MVENEVNRALVYKRKTKKILKRLPLYILVLLIMIFFLFPFYWIFITSFQSTLDLFSVKPVFFPLKPTLNNYRDILFSGRLTIGKALFNSLRAAAVTTLITIIIGSLAAYAFARLRFKSSGFILISLLVTEMLPPIAILIPFFVIYSKLKLLNTWLGLVIGYTSWVLPIAIWILYGYFQSIPEDLEDAARIDGCSRIGALFRVIYPVSAPGLVATAVISFILCMGEFMFALAITTVTRAKTLPVLLGDYIYKYTIEYGKITAAAVIAVIFPIILVLIFQRYLVKGLTTGALKE
ncbi:MAG: carbohydrate ABC transporter permease [Actinobacteria bacterium]|nr:carbohydrate ABC transporter permease [Actinomycetota bacterium]